MRVRTRLFAMQRELAGTRDVPLDLADDATVESAWTALVARHPVLAPGRASLRFAVNGDYADPTTALADGDELAIIPPVSGGADERRIPGLRILELRPEPFGPAVLDELAARLATPADGAVVGFVGRTRETPGTPAPGQEAEAARHAGRAVEELEYEAHETMAIRMLERIADEIAERFGVERIAIVHRTGVVPLGEPSVAVVAVAPHRDAAFDAARYAIDETKARAPIWKAERFADGHVWIGGDGKGRADTEGGAVVRVYVSVDLEGIGGISHADPTNRGDLGYAAAVELMVGEANAAIEGACAGGASELVVNDSHGTMFNLTPADLDPRAVLIQGQKPWSMVEGAGPLAAGEAPRFDVALFVGYHTRAGHPKGVIAHTYTGGPTMTRLDGRPVGESGINASVLGHWGVPVGLVTGDDALAEEIADWLPWAERVIVKQVVSRRAAASVHPSVARDRVRDGAERAIARAAAGELRLLRIAAPITIEVEYRNAGEADHAAVVPGAIRFDDRGVRYTAPDAETAYRGFLAGVRLASIVG